MIMRSLTAATTAARPSAVEAAQSFLKLGQVHRADLLSLAVGVAGGGVADGPDAWGAFDRPRGVRGF